MIDPPSTGLTVIDHLFRSPGFTVLRSGFVKVAKTVPDEEIPDIISKIRETQQSSMMLTKVLAISIGSLVLEYSARRKVSKTQAVDELHLADTLEQADKTILKWTRICERLPEEILSLPDVHLSHLDAAVSYAGPQDPGKLRKFNSERDLMLRELSDDPKGRGKTYVEEFMRGLKDKHGAKRKTLESVQATMTKLIHCYRLLRLSQKVLDPLLEKRKMTRGDLVSWARNFEDELTSRGSIPDDVINFGIPWKP